MWYPGMVYTVQSGGRRQGGDCEEKRLPVFLSSVSALAPVISIGKGDNDTAPYTLPPVVLPFAPVFLPSSGGRVLCSFRKPADPVGMGNRIISNRYVFV